MVSAEIIKTEHQVNSVFLDRIAAFEIYCPQPLPATEKINLLLINDGQESQSLKIQESMGALYNSGRMEALIVVAIRAGEERLQEYGVAGQPDFEGRGAKAQAYADFISKELLPRVHKVIKYPITGKRAFAGCSLGGLSAFDVAWNHPAAFDLVGVFSGAFWWRRKDLAAGYQEDQDRILHRMVRESKEKPLLKFWIMTGTNDETADRNRNFIIDSIDDAIDVIKELEKKGYQRPADIAYYEVVGGTHDTETWSAAFPAFLTWAFSRKSFTH